MIDTRFLMGVLRQLADAGHEAAVPKLVAARGGLRLYIPSAPAEGDELVRLIGLPAACALAALRGNEEVDIPLGIGIGAKKAAIARIAHRPAAEIARTVGTTERHVRRVRNAGGSDPDQGSLF